MARNSGHGKHAVAFLSVGMPGSGHVFPVLRFHGDVCRWGNIPELPRRHGQRETSRARKGDGRAVDHMLRTRRRKDEIPGESGGHLLFSFSVRVPAPPKATSTGLQLTATESPVRTARSPVTGHGTIAFPVTARDRRSTRSAPSTSSPETGRSLMLCVPMGSPCTVFPSPGFRNTHIAAPDACAWTGVFM